MDSVLENRLILGKKEKTNLVKFMKDEDIAMTTNIRLFNKL